jgi:hypothetical protein
MIAERGADFLPRECELVHRRPNLDDCLLDPRLIDPSFAAMPRAALGVALLCLNGVGLSELPRDAMCVPCVSPSFLRPRPRSPEGLEMWVLLARSEGFEPPTPDSKLCAPPFLKSLATEERSVSAG